MFDIRQQHCQTSEKSTMYTHNLEKTNILREVQKGLLLLLVIQRPIAFHYLLLLLEHFLQLQIMYSRLGNIFLFYIGTFSAVIIYFNAKYVYNEKK